MCMLDIHIDDLKAPNLQTWELLLNAFLNGEYYPEAEVVDEFREFFSTLLKTKHYLKYNRVSFDNTQRKLEAFNKTEERVNACLDITKIEINSRKSLLRMVILADYIRDEEFKLSLDGKNASTGAYPIFHRLIFELDKNITSKIALLTGRLCILPSNLLTKLQQHVVENIDLKTSVYSEHDDYVVCLSDSSHLSSAYTKLLEQGDLQIIVGTRALLGEGWDAPFLNTMVMATQTKAYVATNQIRGRVMRIDPNDDFKTASIWHIVATAPEQRLNGLIFDNLQKRFRTFAGIHAYDLRIESGTKRLSLYSEKKKVESTNKNESAVKKIDLIHENNKIMQARLEDDLFNLQARWQNALSQTKHQVFQVGLHHKIDQKSKRFSLDRLVATINESNEKKHNNYVYLAWIIFGFAFYNTIGQIFDGNFAFAAAIALSMTGILFSNAIKFKKHKKKVTAGVIGEKLGKVILLCLHEKGIMKTALKEEKIEQSINVNFVDKNILRFSLNDYSHQENQYFLQAMNDFLQDIDKPRQLLAVTENPTILDLYPIPKSLGSTKKDMAFFLEKWKKVFPQFIDANVLSVNSALGRESLLKASAKKLLDRSEKESPLQMIERWE